MLTFPRYRFMRKYRANTFFLLRQIKKKRRIRRFFFFVYKEQTRKQFIENLFVKKKASISMASIKRLLYFRRYENYFLVIDDVNFFVCKKTRILFTWLLASNYKNFIYFYNNISSRIFKKLWIKARRGRVFFFNYFLFLLESRIDSLLIRLNWLKQNI